MRLRYLPVAGFLLGCSAPVLAQDAAPTAYRFYGGLTAYSSSFQPLGGHSSQNGTQVTLPVQVVLERFRS